MIAKALKSPRHPILVHIIPVRRCNLSCTYCNEYDGVSKPVPTAEMLRRIDLLAALGTTAVHLSGGEPLLHPELDTIIRRIREHGMLAGVLTNGYLLSVERIQRLNRAGLDYLQISIDNVNPDEVSKKSLKVLDQKLQWLAECARFDVNINSVLGSAIRKPEDALIVTRRALGLGFNSTVGIIHDHSGQLRPLSQKQKTIYDEIANRGEKKFSDFVHYSQFRSPTLSTTVNSKITLPRAYRMNGIAMPAADISTFVKMGWSITVPNNEDIPEFLWISTRLIIWNANTIRSRPAHPIARSAVCIEYPSLTSFANSRGSRSHDSSRKGCPHPSAF